MDKTYLYAWNENELEGIEREAFKKANDLNDKILDLKFYIDEINEDWDEYLKYLEDNKISRICEFRGGECIDFDEELLNAIVSTFKKSLTDVKNDINYNTKKINVNRVIDG